jgi:uncharacterized membrane protein
MNQGVKAGCFRVSRRGRGARSRGAALFVVVLVILALTSVAMFAARSASVDTQAAGRYRQMVQTHQVAQLGLGTALFELSSKPELYIRAMTSADTFGGGPPTCAMIVPLADSTLPAEMRNCYRFGYQDLEGAVEEQRNSSPLELVSTPDFVNRTPGGLGLASTHANFSVELVDKNPAPPPPGNAATGNMVFYSVALSARGQIIYFDGTDLNFRDNAVVNPHVSSMDEIRGLVTVGPIPRIN